MRQNPGGAPPLLVVCDVDGTMVDYDEVLTNSFKRLACLVKEHRLPFTIASGRSPDELRFFSLLTSGDIPMVVNNGAGAMLHGKSIWGEFIPPALVKAAIQYADTLGMFIQISDAVNSTVYRMNDYARRHVEELGRNYVFYTPTEDEWPQLRIQKVLITDPQRPGRIDEVLNRLSLAGEVETVRYDARSADLMPRGCTKQSGLARLLAWMNLDAARVMAIGDGRNDIGMLQMAGIGVAVGNAAQDLKAVADYVCENAHTAGVVEAIEHFYLGRLPQANTGTGVPV